MWWRLFRSRGTRDLLLGLALTAATAGLLVYPQESMAAAKAGLSLCFNVIIPSLFPFFVLSSLVVDLGLAGYLGRALEPVMRPLFRVSGPCAAACVLGFIGGYPVGARTAISLYEDGMCTKTEAQRLLAFCNNSGPAFILGVVGAGVFSSSRVGLVLYLAHMLASLLVGLVFRFYRGGETRAEPGRRAVPIQAKRFSAAFTQAVTGSFSSTLNICAFVLFFTVALRLLTLTGAIPALAELLGRALGPLGFDQSWGERLLAGALELTSGVSGLASGGTLAGRAAMAGFMLGWAGVSIHCQVLSFLADSGLSPGTYFLGKLLHGGISAALVWGIGRLVPLAAPVSAILADQVDTIATLDFATTLTWAAVAAWCLFLVFFFFAVLGGKRRKNVL